MKVATQDLRLYGVYNALSSRDPPHLCSGESAAAFGNDRRQSLLLLKALAGRSPPLFGHEPLFFDSSQLGCFPLQLLLLKRSTHTR